MKKLILTFCCILFVVGIASCAKNEPEVVELPTVQPKAEPPVPARAVFKSQVSVEQESTVYLQIESVTVSSFDTTPDWAPPPEPKAIVDGSLLTRWSSNYAEQQWVNLDFGRSKVLTEMTIIWEAAYAIDYDVLGSEDGQNWQMLISLKDQDGGTDELNFAPRRVRFVKILDQKRFNPQWGISIWEVLCFGAPEENPQERVLSCVFPQLANRLYGEKIEQMELDIEPPLASPGETALDELQKGVVYTSWSSTELGSESSDQTLKYLKHLGLSHLGIMVVWYQDDIDSQAISPDVKDTVEDSALVHAINQAHSLGIKVMLKPHVDVATDQWRGDIIPSEKWFVSYQNYIMHYARLAAQYNVELFSIGTELTNVTLPN
ncbi:MAG: discoidin domain-containing protein, partial [Candidatus Omnitrophica bacterium]|nr:discoidin domain-containing protein [Candidatus Omnitrophota bacterium]